MLLPPRCACCGLIGPSPCRSCVGGLRRPPPLPAPPGLDACLALLAYDGPGRDLVAALKFRNARSSVGWLAEGLAGLVRASCIPAPLVVTWAPTSTPRRRARGFDQAELLARRVAARLDAPAAGVLRRGPGQPQTGRNRTERWVGPAFVCRGATRGIAGATVVLVDDVVTTGATLAAAARALRSARPAAVIGLAAARTPAPGRRIA